MFETYNPFKDNRAEQMRDLWKYYVPFPGLDSSGKPLVVEGGRGSGKTMFFRCNSWRQKVLEYNKNSVSLKQLIEKEEFIGFYYRVDTSFVSSMCEREESNWGKIFETYLGICLLIEILDFLYEIEQNVEINESKLLEFVRTFSKRLNRTNETDSIKTFRIQCDEYLDIIEDKVNGTTTTLDGLRFINVNRFITDICQYLLVLFNKKELLFKVFIDEYETLLEYQQKIINTLIKHSTLPVIFNIGLRPKGMKTNATISETEFIESPHDYEILPIGFHKDQYPDILKKICEKRISLGKEQGKIPKAAPEDIEYYLTNYSIDLELERIEKSTKKYPHKDKLNKLIRERSNLEHYDEKEVETFCKTLCYEAPALNSRLHYALLCKKTTYTPTIKELYTSYINKDERYLDWFHNRKNGVIYLLCKETKHPKLYYGFDVFTRLSSNIVRYFLELCEQTFNIAFLNNYQWDQPISPEIQTDAARYVSDYKIIDIKGKAKGKELRIFVQYLGQIFYKLHTEEDTTLGEPEPNHFNTKDLSLDSSDKEILDYAVLTNVLQEGGVTKRKQSRLSPETVDYYLNKIYVPYFGISYRNQRKITFSVNILHKLLSGNEDIAKCGLNDYFKNTDMNDDISQIELCDVEGDSLND